jgi:uridine kinase
MENAHKLDCPPRLTGAVRRRMVKLLQKKDMGNEWDEHEKTFMEFVEFVRRRRAKYFQKKEKPEDVATPQDSEMKASDINIEEEVMEDFSKDVC